MKIAIDDVLKIISEEKPDVIFKIEVGVTLNMKNTIDYYSQAAINRIKDRLIYIKNKESEI